MDNQERCQHEELLSQYAYVAEDIMGLCKPRVGIWLDVGTGPGGVALALAQQVPGSVLVLMDPNPKALGKALQAASELGLGNRVVPIVGPAEAMPPPDNCIELVVSRGSIFSRDDPVRGISEAHRVLRPDGAAMIGGGLGREYPGWARADLMKTAPKLGSGSGCGSQRDALPPATVPWQRMDGDSTMHAGVLRESSVY